MEGFEEAVKYINVYKINSTGIQWERLKLCVSIHVYVEAPKPAEEATDKTVQCFSAFLHQALYREQV